MAIDLDNMIPGKTPLCTRGGHIVLDWFAVERAAETFFPYRALIKLSKRDVELMPYTRSGRRYINVESEYDLMLMGEEEPVSASIKKMYKDAWPYDCMPDPIRAIECVKVKDMHGVRSANKEWGMKVEDKTPIVTSISIETIL